MPLIKAENIKKSLKNSVVINNLSFTLNRGEIVTVKGSNGSGKTTLVQIIAGLLKPDSGIINYINITYKQIGYVPETPVLWSNLSVKEHIKIIKDLYNLKNIDSNNKKLFNELRLFNYKDKIPTELSNGNRKKLNFFLSVLHNPEIYIFDEPFNTLDEESLKIIINYINNLVASNRGVILTTNREDIIKRFNKKVINLNRDIK